MGFANEVGESDASEGEPEGCGRCGFGAESSLRRRPSPADNQKTVEMSTLIEGKRRSLLKDKLYFEARDIVNPMFSLTFHVESLRLFGFVSFAIMMFICMVITETIVYKRISPESTVLYQIFGFNHACNWTDHHPARLVAALFLPFFQLPIIAYICLYHVRLARAVKKKEVPKWLLLYSRVTSPFNVVVVANLYLWLVNSPEGEYGFIAHYLPYVFLQISLGLMAFLQVQYLIAKKQLSCSASPWVAKAYSFFLVVISIFLIMCTLTLLAGFPILDSKNNETHQFAFRSVSNLYVIMAIFFPIFFSSFQRKNGDLHTIAFG